MNDSFFWLAWGLLQVLVHSIGYDTEGQGQIVEYDPAYLSRIGEVHIHAYTHIQTHTHSH
jgi:hypothetical protein